MGKVTLDHGSANGLCFEPGERSRRTRGGRRQSGRHTDQKRDEHGSRQLLAALIADHNKNAIVDGNNLKDVFPQIPERESIGSRPPHAPDMLAVRIQVIDGARTFTLQDSQPCRLLPFHLLRIPDTLLANDSGQPVSVVSK